MYWCVINDNSNYALLSSDKAINRIANNLIQIVLPKLIVVSYNSNVTGIWVRKRMNDRLLRLAITIVIIFFFQVALLFNVLTFLLLHFYLLFNNIITLRMWIPKSTRHACNWEKYCFPVDATTLQTGNCILVSHL
jgi:hypothetical protein